MPNENEQKPITPQDPPAPAADDGDAGILAAVHAAVEATPAAATTEPEKPAAADDEEERAEGDEGKPPAAADEAAPKAADPPAAGDEAAGKTPAGDPPPEPAKEERPSDEFGAPDDRWSDRTKQRFSDIKTKFDERTTERDAALAAERRWVDGVAATGASPEQFGDAMNFLALVNAGDRASLEQARELVKGQYELLSKALGYEAEGHDPLALPHNADLRQEVEEGDIKRERALEIARTRAASKVDEVNRTLQANAQRDQAATQQDVQQGYNDLRTLAEELRAQNPAIFQVKASRMKPLLEQIQASGVHPSRWKALATTAYNMLEVAPTKAAANGGATAANGGAPPPPNPLRPGGGGSANNRGLDKKPTTVEEAVHAAIARGH